ncbi:hypothetical protein [Comamonas sp.]|uniref:hypothetical protein n=1 Tax=Comamonas sp. TaxID=34028 RepID=UPI002898EED1|nr:hypothetical protein [Comamonas sp.]
MSKEITLKEIYDRCDEVGTCWIWRDATTTGGYPIIKGGGRCLYVRRVVAELKGEAPAFRQPVITTCNDKLCCNPLHVETSTTAKVGQAAAKRRAFSSLSRRMKVAAAKRASPSAKLTMEKATQIRLSTKTGKELAKEYGVNLSVIKGIRQNRMWVDFSSPFAGLMR